MLRLSYWQWERHLQKKEYIHKLEQRLAIPPEKINSFLNQDLTEFLYRQFIIKGEYDFSEEIVLDNRRCDNAPGKHVLAPLKIDNTETYIIVNRGFLPLSHSSPEARKEFQKPTQVQFIGLIKPAIKQTFFLQPADPDVGPDTHADNWHRVDLDKISVQLPYPVLPVYVELVGFTDGKHDTSDFINSSSDKADMLVMPGAGNKVAVPGLKANTTYPIPDPDKVIPPGRHLGYVYEWAFMALITFLTGFVLQIRRN